MNRLERHLFLGLATAVFLCAVGLGYLTQHVSSTSDPIPAHVGAKEPRDRQPASSIQSSSASPQKKIIESLLRAVPAAEDREAILFQRLKSLDSQEIADSFTELKSLLKRDFDATGGVSFETRLVFLALGQAEGLRETAFATRWLQFLAGLAQEYPEFLGMYFQAVSRNQNFLIDRAMVAQAWKRLKYTQRIKTPPHHIEVMAILSGLQQLKIRPTSEELSILMSHEVYSARPVAVKWLCQYALEPSVDSRREQIRLDGLFRVALEMNPMQARIEALKCLDDNWALLGTRFRIEKSCQSHRSRTENEVALCARLLQKSRSAKSEVE